MISPVSKQRQCLANLQAWIAALGLPILIPLAVRKDRAFFAPNGLFLAEIDGRPDFARWNAVAGHGVTAICGWREARATCSAQVIQHEGAIEIDFDRFNPDFGAGPAFGHLVECLWPGKTDPFRVQRALLKRGIPGRPT